MFRKLISNLPFNPSLVNQLGFYSDRLKQEKTVRRLGFFLIIIAMFVQMFAVIAPPERSLAASANHIINGLKTKSDILRAWDTDGSDIPAIYGLFGVVRSDIEKLSSTPNDTVYSNKGNDYWTIGRNSLNAYSNVDQKYKNNQITLQYAGADTPKTSDDRFVYNRQLRAWDIVNKSGNTYKAFKGTIASTNKTFWILVDCGNLTMLEKWTPPPPPPPPPAKCPQDPSILITDPRCKECEYVPGILKDNPKCLPPPPPPAPTPALEIKKAILNRPDSVHPGDTFTYLIQYRNTVNGSSAENVVITDQLDTDHFDVVSVSPANVEINGKALKLSVGNLPFSTDYHEIRINVRVKSQVSSGSQICNVGHIGADNATGKDTANICIGVIVPCTFDNTLPDVNNPNCTEPKIICSVVDTALNRTTRRANFKTTVTSTNPANTQVGSYSYDFGDKSAAVTQPAKGLTDEISHTFGAGNYIVSVTVEYSATGVSGKKQATCTSAVSFEEDHALGQSKSVRNITQDKDGKVAEATIVQPKDIIEYSLITTNGQNYERTGVEISDYIGDVLDYATLDTADLASTGGSFNENTKKVIWSDIRIPANGEVKRTFKVKIKDPIPSTNKPSSVGTAFDCKISNEYGNEITMNINCPLVKSLESLPNTGPGSSMIMVSLITTVIGYFFARSRLLVKELNYVRTDYAMTGGM